MRWMEAEWKLRVLAIHQLAVAQWGVEVMTMLAVGHYPADWGLWEWQSEGQHCIQ
jgi:hypothetical protein